MVDLNKLFNTDNLKKAGLFVSGLVATAYGLNKPVSIFSTLFSQPAPMDYYSESTKAEERKAELDAKVKKEEIDLERRKVEIEAGKERREQEHRHRMELLEMQIRAKQAGIDVKEDEPFTPPEPGPVEKSV